jgi:hypothetical protein
MSRSLRTTLITLGVILLFYGTYFYLGRPAIPLPTIRVPVSKDQGLYDFVTATESDEIKLVLNTKGTLNLTSAEEDLLRLDFTPDSLETSLDIALKLSPRNTRTAYEDFIEKFPVYPHLLRYTSKLFFHILPLKLSVIMTAP